MITAFNVWRLTPKGNTLKVGVMALDSNGSSVNRLEFRYDLDYVSNNHMPLDPKSLPLATEKYTFNNLGRSLPGFIDDCLPDGWGEKLIARSMDKRYIDKVSVIKGTANLALIGDIALTDVNTLPQFLPSIKLAKAEEIFSGEKLDFTSEYIVSKYLPLLLMNGGSPGGARPKLLVNDGKEYLYKFNLRNDPFNMAIAEWACLEVAHLAGLDVPSHEVTTFNGEPCFRIERFDVSPEGGRYHLLTLNGLLKSEEGDDPLSARYEDIARLIHQYSYRPVEDVRQLFAQMLLNSELKNTDDHLRNFSFIHDDKGWHLSPVYDITPDPTVGKYH